MGFSKTFSDSVKLDKGVNLLQQTYEKMVLPQGVVVVKLNVFPDDQGGWFKENLRFDSEGNVVVLKEQGIDFKVKQTNTSLIAAHGKRFWHLHPQKSGRKGQNEIWTTNGTLLLGLVDLRKDSPTHGVKSKIVLSPDMQSTFPLVLLMGS